MIADDIWNDLFGGFESMNRRIGEMFSSIDPCSDVKTYGYTVYQGPDGVRHVREFGNCAPGTEAIRAAGDRFVDVTDEGNAIRAVLEMPGVEKSDIDLRCSGRTLSVKVNGGDGRFDRDVALPRDVDPSSAKAEYNNGLLEVTFKPTSPNEEGTRISIQ